MFVHSVEQTVLLFLYATIIQIEAIWAALQKRKGTSNNLWGREAWRTWRYAQMDSSPSDNYYAMTE